MQVPALRGAKSLLLPHSRDSILMPSCCSPSPHEALSCKSPHFAGQTLYCSRIRGTVFCCPRVVLRTRCYLASPRISRGGNSSLLPHSRGSILMPSCCSPHESGYYLASPRSSRGKFLIVPAFAGQFSDALVLFSARGIILQVPALRGENSSLLPHSRGGIIMPPCCSPHEVLSCKSPHFAGQILHCSRIRGTVF